MTSRVRKVSWLVLVLMTMTSEVRSGYYIQCYNETLDFGYTLCLSTDTDRVENWFNATAACSSNGSTLIDVNSAIVTEILNKFRAENGSSLSTTYNWIDVYAPEKTCEAYQWISGAIPATDLEVQSFDPRFERFAVIRGDSSNTNRPIYYSQENFNRAAYICQFAGYTGCVDGLVRHSSCYMKYTESLSWFDASNSCLQKGGSLAIFADLGRPYNDPFLTAWLNLTTTSPDYWIGLVLPWWQRHNGDILQYSNWMDPFMMDRFFFRSRAQCVFTLDKSGWDSDYCTTLRRFVCQTMQPGPTTSAMTTTTASASFSCQQSSLSIGGALVIGIVIGIVITLGVGVIVYFVQRHHKFETIGRVIPCLRQIGEHHATEVPDDPVRYEETPTTAGEQYATLSEATRAVPEIYEKIKTTSRF